MLFRKYKRDKKNEKPKHSLIYETPFFHTQIKDEENKD